jgi:outer membrane usher protein
MNLDTSSFLVVPGYKSGYLFSIGSVSKVFVEGLIFNHKGELLSLEVGEIFQDDNPDIRITRFFSGRKGNIFLAGLKPGSYTMKLVSYPSLSYKFTISEDQVGRVDLGELHFLRK